MEILLLAFIFGFLLYHKNTSDKRFDRLDEKFRELHKTIEGLKQTGGEVEKPVEKFVPEPQIEKEKTIPVLEKLKPTVFPAAEKIVFAMNTDLPKPAYTKPEPYVPELSWWEKFKEKNPDLEKFIGENLINKIGVLILVLGISYFVKFAIDKDWINEPARVGIGVLCGALVMAFAHKLRKNYAPFSSVLVAGAIAIFYFTIGIAFHDYHLFNQSVAFVIMTVITAFSCLISISYDRKELAVLSLIGGFAVPFMVRSGEGNYVVLFTYILILNIGILALAYHKKWRIINVLSYVFTLLLYGTWLFKTVNEKNPHYLGALAFGFAFYFLFILINIINNLRTKGTFTPIELSILASNTFLFYGAGMVILEPFHPEFKGLFTAILGLLNFIYAWFLYKKFGLDKTAVYLLIGLTLTFITLAIPIQFEGNSITVFWAAEAVLLMWLAQKSKINSYRFASVIVHFLMVISLIMDWKAIYTVSNDLNIVLNRICITGLFAVISLFSISILLKKETENQEQFGIIFNPKKYLNFIKILGVLLAYFVGLFEVAFQANHYVAGVNSATMFPIVYHLLFSALLFFVLCKSKKSRNLKLAAIIGISNSVLFAFWFSNFAFYEHENYISTGIPQRIAFYLHYVSLMTVLYFGYQLYLINKEKVVFEFFKTNIFVWISTFLVIYIASSELMLHGLVVSNSPVTLQDIQADSSYEANKTEEFNYLKTDIAHNFVANVRTQIIKTGFPILWGAMAFVFLIFGIKKQSKILRIIALSLLGITILKLFLYDIRNVSETGKIIAFILLGLLILIISFVYHKIKVLVLDDTKSNLTNEKE